MLAAKRPGAAGAKCWNLHVRAWRWAWQACSLRPMQIQTTPAATVPAPCRCTRSSRSWRRSRPSMTWSKVLPRSRFDDPLHRRDDTISPPASTYPRVTERTRMNAVSSLHIDHLGSAKRVFRIEAEAVGSLAAKLDDNFSSAVEHIRSSSGRVIVCGMGKSGIIGKKIAATLASTGTPSFFMHPGEAYHGDLGMVTPDDVSVAISFSGETDEVIKLLSFLQDNGNILVAITGNPDSTLARAADCHLDV